MLLLKTTFIVLNFISALFTATGMMLAVKQKKDFAPSKFEVFEYVFLPIFTAYFIYLSL